MREVILVLNAGSSSIKFALFEVAVAAAQDGLDPALLLRGQIEGIGRAPRFQLGRTPHGDTFAAPPDGAAVATATKGLVPHLRLRPAWHAGAVPGVRKGN